MRHDRDDVTAPEGGDASHGQDLSHAGVDEIPPRPQTRGELRTVVERLLDLEVDPDPIIPGHHNVLDYLEHTFFEGEPPRPLLPPAISSDGQDPDPTVQPGPLAVVDCVVWANRGGGKTMAGAIATLLDLLFKDGIQVRILGGSLDQSRRMHDHLRGFLERPALRRWVKGRITDRRITLVNKSTVELLSQSQTSVRGTRVQKLRCDEVELFDPMVWEAAQLATRSRRCAGHWVRGAVECLSTMHLARGIMHRLVEQAAAGTRRLFKWGLVDCLENCEPARPCESCSLLPECSGRAKRLPRSVPGHITIDDAITMKSRVTLETWEAEMLCLRPSRTATVLPEFDRSVHVVDSIPVPAADGEGKQTWVGGMDFGMRSPTVVLWGMLDEKGVLWIAHERSVSGAVLDDHIDAMLAPQRPRLRWVAVDPSGCSVNAHSGVSTTDAMARRGIDVRWQPGRRVLDGILLIRARLRPASGEPPRLFVHRSCETLIESLERFSYMPDEFSDKPDKTEGFDHAVDALRYLVQYLDTPRRSCSGSYTVHGW
ncbi:MAG: hypothetical protein AMXMBFR58_19240 [Phycisphaerae bacterium]